MSRTRLLAASLVVFTFTLAAPFAAAQSLPPLTCSSNSVLPSSYQVYQSDSHWMGVAVGPVSVDYTVYLEVLDTANQSFAPAVISGVNNGTNFVMRNFAGRPDEWVYLRALSAAPTNVSHTIAWDPGQGVLAPGAWVSEDYGGLEFECDLVRVRQVYLEAGNSYNFELTTDHPGDDVRMALVQTGGRPDGWVTREDALFDVVASPDGAAVPQVFTASTTGNYGLIVFVNDLTVAGGVSSLRYGAYVPPADQPDLVITNIQPTTASTNQPVQATITVANIGGVGSPACGTRVTLDGLAICEAAATAAIPAGGSTTVTCNLGTLSAGNYVLAAHVDYAEAVPEGSNDNNQGDALLAVTSPTLPDLVIANVQPRTVLPDNSTQITVWVRNDGTPAPASSTLYEVDGGATALSLPTPAIGAGQTVTVTGILGPQTGGSHPVRVMADEWDAITEVYDTNNEFFFTLVAAAPNLIVESFQPAEFRDDEPLDIEVTVRNIGNQACGPSYTEVVFTGGGPQGQTLTPGLAPGAAVSVTVQVPAPASVGAQTIEICADVGTQVTESYEGDNCLTGAVTIQPTRIIYPDPAYASIQAAIDAVAPGGQVLIRGGTYRGDGNRDLDFHGKDLSVMAYLGEEVIIDCEGNPDFARRGFRFVSLETRAALVQGLTIINGWNDTGSGGGIFVGNADPTIRECIIRDCHAQEGSAVSCSANRPARPLFERCTIVGNSAYFGAIYVAQDAEPEFRNTLVADNNGTYGAVICNADLGTPHPVFTCSNIWGNGGGDWVGCIASQASADYNMSVDPLFCDPATDDYHLAANSPCAEAMNADCGQVGALPAACGTKGGTVRHVRADGTGEYLTIQHAINNAVDGDIVELANGVYTGTGNHDITTLGKRIVVRSASGNPAVCRIDAQHAYRGFVINNGEGARTVIAGIGIHNGQAATGGGILCNGASPTLVNLEINDCHATDDGGGLHCEAYASPTVTDCVFVSNSAEDDGGGIYAYNWSSPTIQGCLFEYNYAADRGGGTAFSVNCFPELSGCTWRGNEAVNGGGLIFVYAYGPVTDSVFLGNTATYGGGFQGYGNAQVTLTRCTLNGNTAPNGANVYVRNNSSPTFTNCIVSYGLGSTGFARYADDCNPTLVCSDVFGNEYGDWTAMISGQLGINGNLWLDPLFCDRLGGDVTLRGDSPCAPANNGACGRIGALPVGCTGSYLIKPDGSGDFATIQEAIDVAVAGETIVLADGTFTGTGNRDLNFRGKAITMRSQSGDAAMCVINCQGSATTPHGGIDFTSAETASSVLEDVTIQGAWKNTGAGGRISGGSPVLRRVVFRNCDGVDGGGLAISGGATPTLEDCVFEDCDVSDAAGGVYVNASWPNFLRCTFRNNTATWGGGAVYHQYAGPNYLECTFESNSSAHWGGAVHNRYTESAPHFTTCVFVGNTAPMGGAVYNRDAAFPSFTTCTFTGNASANGAVLHTRSGSQTTMIRCLLTFSPEGAAATSDGTGGVTFFCSDIYGNAGGDWVGFIAGQWGVSDNFSADPDYCGPADDNYMLANVSPCSPAHSPCGFVVGALGEGCALSDTPDPGAAVPATLVLEPNVPNPFNPMTTIAFSTPRAGPVEVIVYGLDGRRVATLHQGPLPAGRHALVWRARDDAGRELASGVYLVRVEAGAEVRVSKMTLMR